MPRGKHGHHHRNTAESFWARVNRAGSDDCWEWTGGRSSGTPYGCVGWNGREVLTHRLAWQLTNGDIPAGQQVLHTCDNPPCCNPAHLYLGTHQDNMRDMNERGRQVGNTRSTPEQRRAARLSNMASVRREANGQFAKGD